MKNKTSNPKTAKLFALIGTIMLWLPVLFTLVISIIGSIKDKSFLFDYLMPAELFPVAALGSILLIIGAFLARKQYKFICISSLIMAACLAAGQLTAFYTGLASGEIPAKGTVFIIVIILIAIYSALLLLNCITGIILSKRLFRKKV